MPRHKTITYKFRDLEELASFFKGKALERRNKALDDSKHPLIIRLLKSEASTWEEAAHIIENMEWRK